MLGMGKNQQYAFFATHDCFVPTEVMPVIIPGSTPAAFNSLPTGYTLPCDGTPKSMEDLGMVPAQALVYFQYVCGAQIPVGIGTHEFVCSARGDLDGDGNVVEILYCTDQDNNGVGLPSPATGAACSFPYDPVRVSLGLY